jgi:glycerophosphoryl diester phosphodiesterase
MAPADGRPLNIAHRGARGTAPENTLTAARKAHEFGADLWELDVQLSRDGVPVVFHDETLERTTDIMQRPEYEARRPWPVYAFELSELRSLDAGSWFVNTDPFGRIAAGRVTSSELDSYLGLIIPTLEEALVLTRDLNWRVNIEIKDLEEQPGYDEVVSRVVSLVNGLGMTDRVLFSSFNPDYVRELGRLVPDSVRAVIVEDPQEDPIGLVRSADAQAYHPAAWVIDPEEIPVLQRQGIKVNVWTINLDKDMRLFRSAGADGIITDFPEDLKIILNENPA